MVNGRHLAFAATTALVLAAAAPAHAVVLAPGASSNSPDSLTDIGSLIDTISGTFVFQQVSFRFFRNVHRGCN